MGNRLLDLISEAYALPVGDHMVRAKLGEAVRLVEGGGVFDRADGYMDTGSGVTSIPNKCIIIPLTPPVPEPTDYDRALARVAHKASRTYAQGDPFDYRVARAISAKRKELDSA